MTELLSQAQRDLMMVNGNPYNRGMDHFPVVKLFTPDAGATWLLTELDSEDENIAFGLCDLGLGFPELGYVSLTELKAFESPMGLWVEQDQNFKAKAPLSVYAQAARSNQRIVEDNENLVEAIIKLAKEKKSKHQPS
jgi:hypothetical protein